MTRPPRSAILISIVLIIGIAIAASFAWTAFNRVASEAESPTARVEYFDRPSAEPPTKAAPAATGSTSAPAPRRAGGPPPPPPAPKKAVDTKIYANAAT